MDKAEIMHAWYGVPAPEPWVVGLFLFVMVVLFASAFLIDPRRNLFCPIHIKQGVKVTLVHDKCVLCQYPEVK